MTGHGTSVSKQPPFRQATPADHLEVLSLIRQYYAFDTIPFDEQGIAAGLSTLLADPALGQVLLIEHQARTVGYLILTFGFDLEFGGRQATVTDVFLQPQARGLHLGTAVFAALELRCLDLQVVALELQVEHDNTAAQGFYNHLGFQTHDRVPMSKRLNGKNLLPDLSNEVPL